MSVLAKDSNLPPIDFHKTAIFLDVDGTLLDIADVPTAVQVPESLRTVLARLDERLDGAIAFISGRPIVDIDRLFSPLRLAAAGGHGAELRLPDGTLTSSAPMPDHIRSRLRAIAAEMPGLFLEDKGYGASLHYRQTPQFEAALWREIAKLEAPLHAAGLDILSGKFILEIRPAGTDKGKALQAFMTQPPFAGRRPLFAGDDRTDDDALAMLSDYNGIGIAVGRQNGDSRYHARRPADIRHWLSELAGAEQ